MRMVVVLPAPLGPRNPVTVPGEQAKVTSWTTVRPPNRFVRPLDSIMPSRIGVAPASGHGHAAIEVATEVSAAIDFGRGRAVSARTYDAPAMSIPAPRSARTERGDAARPTENRRKTDNAGKREDSKPASETQDTKDAGTTDDAKASDETATAAKSGEEAAERMAEENRYRIAGKNVLSGPIEQAHMDMHAGTRPVVVGLGHERRFEPVYARRGLDGTLQQ